MDSKNKLRYIEFFKNLSPKRRTQLFLLFFLSLFSSSLEVVSVGSIIPLITVILDPQKLVGFQLVALFMESLSINNADQLVIPILILFGFIALVSALVRISLLWYQTKLSFSIGTELGSKVFELSLKQDYLVHISRSSHEVVNAVRNAKSLNSLFFSPIFRIISSVFTLLSIFFFLFYVEPKLTIIIFVSFSSLYLFLGLLSKKTLDRNGIIVAKSQVVTSRILFEGLNAFRDLILNSLQNYYTEVYRKIDNRMNLANSKITFIGKVPWYIVEAAGVILIAIVAAVEKSQGKNLEDILPFFGALALGAQKMLPIIQVIFSDWAMLKTGDAKLVDILKYLNQKIISRASTESFQFQEKILIKDVNFSYNHQSSFQIHDLCLEIKKGEKVGFVGTTGEGKSTILDIIIGLLNPSSGKIFIDNQELTEANKLGWHELISSVPQSIYLTEGSIRENIALGLSASEINEDALIQSAKDAQLLSFINSLPLKFETHVGERGVKLSGGQKQRIGIARALYKKAQVLVLDEATSSLDTETETAVMESVNAISSEITVLMIAHRVSTLKSCDKIIEIKKGKINKIGNYKELYIDGSLNNANKN